MARDPAIRLLLALKRLLRGPRGERAVPSKVRELVEQGELAPRHLGALAVVAIEGPLSVSDLARREGLALTTASLLVSQLAEAGLVERREDDADHRRTVVSIAPEHRAESTAVLEARAAPLRRAIERMGPERTAALLEALEILTEEMEAVP
ncbi:MAG: MarR family winged helix-turn-helix transcriptional regulator [Acidimicrobiales bacterium]